MYILDYLYSEDLFRENIPLKGTSEKLAEQVVVEISNTYRNDSKPQTN